MKRSIVVHTSTCFAILGLLLFVPVTGCERDFPNPNAPIVEDVPIQSLVTGAEAGMRIDLAIYLRAVSILAREAYYFEPADPRYTGELMQGTPDPGGFILNRPWSGRYRTAVACNILLGRAEELSGAEKAGVEGFAKTIMAYQLLLNLNYLDENGIRLDFSGNRSIPFATKTEALQRIAGLLDEANSSLANAGSAFSFRLSTGFTGFDTPAAFARFNRALKARVSVYRGRFDDAMVALNASFLNPSPAAVNDGVYHVYGTGLGDQGNEIYENPLASFVKFMAHLSVRTAAEAGDQRFSSKIVVRSDTTRFDELQSNLAVAITASSIDRIPIIRNEELLLLRAEAKIGMSDYPGAEGDMNIVRQAAGLTAYNGTDATNAVDRLLHERRYSLFCEGHRWVDLRRHGRLNQIPVDRPSRDVIIDRMPIPETERPTGG